MDIFCFELSKLFVNSGATDIVLVTLSSTAVERAIAQCTSRWAMARGHRLNTSIVLAAVHGLSGLFQAVSAVEPFTLSSPSHSVPVPNRPTRLCGRKATLNQIDDCEPVWPSGKALVRLVSGRTSVRYRFGSPFSSKGCGLWTLSCDFVHHLLLKH